MTPLALHRLREMPPEDDLQIGLGDDIEEELQDIGERQEALLARLEAMDDGRR